MLAMGMYLKMLVALLVIVDPPGAIPAFVAMAPYASRREKLRIARVAAMAVAILLFASALVGQALLGFFGITIPSFKVGGAILIFMMALAMLQAEPIKEKQSAEEAQEAGDRHSIAVVPLAIPLLAGPGAISAVIIYGSEGQGVLHYGMIGAICLIVGVVTWISLSMATRVGKIIGKTGINIAIRLMGIILAALAVEIFVSGIVVLLPGLKG